MTINHNDFLIHMETVLKCFNSYKDKVFPILDDISNFCLLFHCVLFFVILKVLKMTAKSDIVDRPFDLYNNEYVLDPTHIVFTHNS